MTGSECPAGDAPMYKTRTAVVWAGVRVREGGVPHLLKTADFCTDRTRVRGVCCVSLFCLQNIPIRDAPQSDPMAVSAMPWAPEEQSLPDRIVHEFHKLFLAHAAIVHIVANWGL